MRLALTRISAGLAVVGLGLGFSVAAAPVASALPANAVSFACFNDQVAGCPQAGFSGYASGSELHLSGLDENNTTVANVDQGFSGASTASTGLTKPIVSETTSVVQPAQSSATKAYGTGAGLEIGAGTDDLSTTDQHQIKVAGRAEQVAPPNGPAQTAQIAESADPVADASLLKGEGAAVYDNQVCPLGQPISYGVGDAVGAHFLVTGTTPTLSTTGPSAQPALAQSTSETFLSSNGDGSFGLTTLASDVVAPLSANLPGGFSVEVGVQTASGNDDPVTLTAKTTGESTGASIKLSTDDLLVVSLLTPASSTPTKLVEIPLSAIGEGGLHIPLSTSSTASTLTTLDGAVSSLAGTVPGVGTTLSGLLSSSTATSLLNQIGTTVSDVANQVATVNLGSIDVDTYPHPIGDEDTPTVPAVAIGGTSASGALDLLHVKLDVTGSAGGTALPVNIPIANLFAGHLEASSSLSAPILCNLPVIKSADPVAVQGGQSFVYNIQVPDPAKLDLIDCSLIDMNVTDTITDYQGTPSFSVTAARDTQTGAVGTIQTLSPHDAVVTWTGLSYKVAPTGQPPNPPVPLQITVSVPSDSPPGVIMDLVQAVATPSGCQGGVAGAADVSAAAANGVSLAGSFTLHQPSVTAPATPAAAATQPKTLPFTGAMGGFWQPVGGLAALALGGGGLALARRARRTNTK